MSVQTEIPIGSEFVGYRIDELIGRGGMGVVYRACDLRLKRTVALKLVAPELALDQRFRERFAREAELAMSLEHPNVVPIHDAGDIDGRLYLAMRHVEGTDLRALLHAEGALDQARALAICSQVANALDAAHGKGLVHRDVKPSNVLLDTSEHVYLADFGLTRRLDEQGGPAGEGRSVGTPAYLAPEQIEGGSIDGRTDVYSLGCLLYECLTGETPFAHGSRLAVAWAHLEEEPPSASERRPELPEAIDAVIRKAMAKGPEDRYATCGAFLQAAGEALGLSRPSGLSRRMLALLLAGAFVALAATLAALVATRGGRAPVSSPLFARPNTLARIDSATNAVSDVIRVGKVPVATAARGRSVWVYNREDDTIWEVDPVSKTVRERTRVSAFAEADNVFVGPALTADSVSAWFVGNDLRGRGGVLTRVCSGGVKRDYRLPDEPRGVAVGFGAVWIVGRGQHGSELLRIDPSTGRVTRSRRFRSELDSIGVGDGAVYVVGGSEGTLYRIDPRSPGLKLLRQANLGGRASRPLVTSDFLGFGTTELGGTGLSLDPVTLKEASKDSNCCPPQWGEARWSHGWLWWSDWPTGSVYRQHGAGARPQAIHVTKTLPQAAGPCLTSIDIGGGGVWVTAAAPVDSSCSP